MRRSYASNALQNLSQKQAERKTARLAAGRLTVSRGSRA